MQKRKDILAEYQRAYIISSEIIDITTISKTEANIYLSQLEQLLKNDDEKTNAYLNQTNEELYGYD